MGDFKRIRELAEKINNLTQAAERNQNQLSVIDKDLMTGYIRELYELILAVQPGKSNVENKTFAENKEVRPVENKKENAAFNEPVVVPVTTVKNDKPSTVSVSNTSENKKPEEPVKHEVKKPSGEGEVKKSISEIYAEKGEGKKVTLNEKYKSEGKIVADKLKHTPIKDLKAHIGLNKRFNFITTLFHGKEQEYEAAIAKVNDFKNYDEAISYIQDQLVPKYGWKEDELIASDFFMLVMRRYLH